ncbi:MAG: CDP-alcohol phosphatidyltransferase family protein [Archangium sp.]|nr:CDP-alcohol phosphatidyltransferase family protein [Archangium sp.]
MAPTTTRPLLRELGTLPNLLTLLRVPLAALIWVAPANVTWLLVLMVVAAVSDWLDGFFARRSGAAAESMGAWLDPLCDKTFIVSLLVAVWVAQQPPVWMALVASTREVVLLPLVIARFAVPRLRKGGIPWRAMLLGKATTVAQFALFAAVLWNWEAGWLPLTLVCGALGLGAGLQYSLRAWRAVHGGAGA